MYGEGDETFRARHAAVRRAFGPLFEWTARRGMRVFLTTDMLTVTPPLARYLRRLAPAAGVGGIDASDPAVWAVYRAGLDELFDTMPSISGLVIRFGEGGNLYHTAGWPYRSEVAVRDAKSLRAMLHGLLPLFERRANTLVLRSWTVGVGSIGRLHIDPAVYERVLGDIDSPSLIVSTKYTKGDFFSYLPLNPTLMSGRHRRIVEFQARPEFEGFGAFPDFLGEEWANALRTIRAKNPRLAGTYIYSQAGGPLRAGPRMLYPLHGFWLWTDANVFVGSQLAMNSSADVRALARQWASERFGDPRGDDRGESGAASAPSAQRVGDAVANMLIETRRAVLDGFYIRAFAEREVRVPGLELPPLMWIFEWDRVGGWHSLLSLVYRGSRDAVDVSIAEGHEAAAIVRRQRELLRAAFAAGSGGMGSSTFREEALRSLEYQETLFDTLAAWRQTFLSYYRWLDTGDSEAWTRWRDSRQQFEIAARRHVDRFGHDLGFPAFDLRSAFEAEANAGRAVWGRRLAVGLLIALVTLVGLGSPLVQRWRPAARLSAKLFARLPAFGRIARLTFTAAVTPWRLVREPIDLESSAAVSVLAIALVALLAATLTSFTTDRHRHRLSAARGCRRARVREHGDRSREARGPRPPARRIGRTVDARHHPAVRVDRLRQPHRLLVSLLDLADLPHRRGDDRRGDGRVDRLHDARIPRRRWLARPRRRMPRGGGRRRRHAERAAARMARRPAIARSSSERRARHGDDAVRAANLRGCEPRHGQHAVHCRRADARGRLRAVPQIDDVVQVNSLNRACGFSRMQ